MTARNGTRRPGGSKLRITFRFPQAPKAERPPKGEAVALPNALMGKLCRDGLTSRELRLFWFLAFETYGQHRLAVEVSDSEIAAQTKIPKRFVSPTLEKLRARELLRSERAD